MTARVLTLAPGGRPSRPQTGRGVAPPDALDVLIRSLARNRFLPQPPAPRCGSGDGDFRAIGAEFLGWLVRLGGLRPDHVMLEVGCGIGRLAVPLTQYLSPSRGSYLGLDVCADGIHWCHEHIAQRYGNFRFQHLDVRHPLYNPGGQRAGAATVFPVADESVDFACLVSVVTHLLPEELEANLKQVARVLRPGARCLVSAFLINEECMGALDDARGARYPFGLDAGPSPYVADGEHPTAAVAYDETHLHELLCGAGLRRSRRTVYGHWCGREAAPFQDLCVYQRPERRP